MSEKPERVARNGVLIGYTNIHELVRVLFRHYIDRPSFTDILVPLTGQPVTGVVLRGCRFDGLCVFGTAVVAGLSAPSINVGAV